RRQRAELRGPAAEADAHRVGHRRGDDEVAAHPDERQRRGEGALRYALAPRRRDDEPHHEREKERQHLQEKARDDAVAVRVAHDRSLMNAFSGPPGLKIETRSSRLTTASIAFAASAYMRRLCVRSMAISAPKRFAESAVVAPTIASSATGPPPRRKSDSSGFVPTRARARRISCWKRTITANGR